MASMVSCPVIADGALDLTVYLQTCISLNLSSNDYSLTQNEGT